MTPQVERLLRSVLRWQRVEKFLKYADIEEVVHMHSIQKHICMRSIYALLFGSKLQSRNMFFGCKTADTAGTFESVQCCLNNVVIVITDLIIVYTYMFQAIGFSQTERRTVISIRRLWSMETKKLNTCSPFFHC